MSYIRVKIKPVVLVDAVEKSSRTLDEVKNRFKSFERWISQELDPTFVVIYVFLLDIYY